MRAGSQPLGSARRRGHAVPAAFSRSGAVADSNRRRRCASFDGPCATYGSSRVLSLRKM